MRCWPHSALALVFISHSGAALGQTPAMFLTATVIQYFYCSRDKQVIRSHFKITLLSIATCLTFVSVALADFSGRVVGVADGDTITVLHNGFGERFRLTGIDCPEKRQPFGNRAKQFTSSLVFGKTVTVRGTGRDRYGRTLGVVFLPDGRNLNQELVKAGLAWWYRQYSKDETLAQLEQEARTARRGLWVDPNPIPPWE